MPLSFEKFGDFALAFRDWAEKLSLAFPELDWDLKRAGYNMDAIEYLSVVILFTLLAFIFSSVFAVILFVLGKGKFSFIFTISVPLISTIFAFFYALLLPKLEIIKKAKAIDRDLEYMLKDIRIQLTAGIPLFDTINNIAHGNYGECSRMCNRIVTEVEAGKSMIEVFNDFGVISPSEYMRRVMWQLANAMQTGSDIKKVLDVISEDIRRDKENSIEDYNKKLSVYGLMYLIFAVVVPSMGITLLLILSSFFGGGLITKQTFWMLLIGVALMQISFIIIVNQSRPKI
ncbi:MAG TPA: type II secretion system F family protein [Candidatus Altiarchaeales archaeon]|nr:type II secretion system F family protein [Candidatus Altiarchaeales archaeon]